MKASVKQPLILTFILDESNNITGTLYTSESNSDVHFVPDAFLCHKSDSYLLLPLLRPSLERVWHPLSLTLYGETMGSGGEELLCEQEREWGDRGSKSRMKTGKERESVRGRNRALRGDHSLTILSNHESDKNVTWMTILVTPSHCIPISPPQLRCHRENSIQKSLSSLGKCKEKQETVREWVLVLNKSLSLAFFEWVLKIPSWQSARGSWMEKDKRGAEVGGLAIVFVPFLSVLAL